MASERLTIEELEEILRKEGEYAVEVLPSGEIRRRTSEEIQALQQQFTTWEPCKGPGCGVSCGNPRIVESEFCEKHYPKSKAELLAEIDRLESQLQEGEGEIWWTNIYEYKDGRFQAYKTKEEAEYNADHTSNFHGTFPIRLPAKPKEDKC